MNEYDPNLTSMYICVLHPKNRTNCVYKTQNQLFQNNFSNYDFSQICGSQLIGMAYETTSISSKRFEEMDSESLKELLVNRTSIPLKSSFSVEIYDHLNEIPSSRDKIKRIAKKNDIITDPYSKHYLYDLLFFKEKEIGFDKLEEILEELK